MTDRSSLAWAGAPDAPVLTRAGAPFVRSVGPVTLERIVEQRAHQIFAWYLWREKLGRAEAWTSVVAGEVSPGVGSRLGSARRARAASAAARSVTAPARRPSTSRRR